MNYLQSLIALKDITQKLDFVERELPPIKFAGAVLSHLIEAARPSPIERALAESSGVFISPQKFIIEQTQRRMLALRPVLEGLASNQDLGVAPVMKSKAELAGNIRRAENYAVEALTAIVAGWKLMQKNQSGLTVGTVSLDECIVAVNKLFPALKESADLLRETIEGARAAKNAQIGSGSFSTTLDAVVGECKDFSFHGLLAPCVDHSWSPKTDIDALKRAVREEAALALDWIEGWHEKVDPETITKHDAKNRRWPNLTLRVSENGLIEIIEGDSAPRRVGRETMRLSEAEFETLIGLVQTGGDLTRGGRKLNEQARKRLSRLRTKLKKYFPEYSDAPIVGGKAAFRLEKSQSANDTEIKRVLLSKLEDDGSTE